MVKTIFMVNPHAGGGNARRVWATLEAEAFARFDQVAVLSTENVADVPGLLQECLTPDVECVISVGGDGTNHAILNALMMHREQHAQHKITYGLIPAGTGRDFARGQGLPMKPREALHHLATKARPRAVDVGCALFGGHERYFLNISSTGVTDAVVQKVENSAARRPWTFLAAIASSLLTYQPEAVRVFVDDRLWFEGEIYIVAIANSSTFGQGVKIAPEANLADGLFEVVVVENMPLLRLARLFPTIYSGSHIQYDVVHVTRGRTVRVESITGERIPFDLDGEAVPGDAVLTYEMHPGALTMLL